MLAVWKSPLGGTSKPGTTTFSPRDVRSELYWMCWTTEREASEAAGGRSSDSDSFRDRPIHTNDDNDNNSPVACLVARRYRHAVRSLGFPFVLFVHCDSSLCSNCNNHHGMFRPDIFHREEGLQSTGSVALEWAVETIKFTTTTTNHHGSDRFSAASMHDQKREVEWSGVELSMANG